MQLGEVISKEEIEMMGNEQIRDLRIRGDEAVAFAQVLQRVEDQEKPPELPSGHAALEKRAQDAIDGAVLCLSTLIELSKRGIFT